MPASQYEDATSRYSNHEQFGMSLRDWFATQVREDELSLPDTAKEAADLCGVSVDDYVKDRSYWYSVVAKARYQWADVMIAERSKD